MSFCVANCLQRGGSLILRMRLKSQGEKSGEYGGCSYSSHPQRHSSCPSHFVLCGLALFCTVHKIQTFIPNATSHLSHQEVPVVLCGHCSAMRNKVANNDTLDVIRDNHHQFDLLTDVLAENFLPIMQLYRMVGHYSQGLPLIHCDIPSHFSVGELLFWCKHGLLPYRMTLTNWLISQPSLRYYQLSQSHLSFCKDIMPAELPNDTYTFVIRSHIYKKKNSCHDLCPNPRINNVFGVIPNWTFFVSK